ncbi:MAG: S-layer homology domain-containing protein [Clostridia bacterium]|nr:S-layer homology domain-containing protein [Clostridia bacterium]
MNKIIKYISAFIICTLIINTIAFAASDIFDFENYESTDETFKKLPPNGELGTWSIYPSASQSDTAPHYGVAPIETEHGTAINMIIPKNHLKMRSYALTLRYNFNQYVTDGIEIKASVYMNDAAQGRGIQLRENDGADNKQHLFWRVDKNGQLSAFGSSFKNSSNQNVYLSTKKWYDVRLKYNVASGYYEAETAGEDEYYFKSGYYASYTGLINIHQILFGYNSPCADESNTYFDNIEITPAQDVYPNQEFNYDFDDFSSASNGQTAPQGFTLSDGIADKNGVWASEGALSLNTAEGEASELSLKKNFSSKLWGKYMLSFDMTLSDSSPRFVKFGNDTLMDTSDFELEENKKYSVKLIADSASKKANAVIYDEDGNEFTSEADMTRADISGFSISVSGGETATQTLVDNLSFNTVYEHRLENVSCEYIFYEDSVSADVVIKMRNPIDSIESFMLGGEETNYLAEGRTIAFSADGIDYGTNNTVTFDATDIFGNTADFSHTFAVPEKLDISSVDFSYSDGKITAMFDAKSNNRADHNGIFALYITDSANVYKSFVTNDVTITNELQTFSVEADYTEGDIVQAFVWDSLGEMNNLVNVSTVGNISGAEGSDADFKKIEANPDTGYITVYGYGADEEKLLFAVYKDGVTPIDASSDDIVFVREFEGNISNDVFSFCFNGESGRYGVLAKTEGNSEYTDDAFTFISTREKNEILQMLNASQPDYDTIITTKSFVLEIDTAFYLALSEDDREKVCKALGEARSKLPGDEYGGLSQFKANYNAEILLVSVCSETDCDKIAELIEAFEPTLMWTKAKAYEFYKDFSDDEKNSVHQKIAKITSLDNVDELKNALSDATALTVIDTADADRDIEYVLKNLLGADMSKFNKLSASKQDKVIDAVKKESPFADADECIEFFNDEITSYSKKESGSSSSGGGSSWTPQGPDVNFDVTPPVASTPTVEASVQFNDLASVEWAREAIEGLWKKGIVNGKSNETFAPNDLVTREEFVKMLVQAFGKYNASAKADFADADTNCWYYPYVASAFESGIVNGISHELFGVGKYITREDLAVMAVRAMGENSSTDALSFADEAQIASYARGAVALLSSKGIVNGREDNCFVPKGNATRAEAAKILYYLIKE